MRIHVSTSAKKIPRLTRDKFNKLSKSDQARYFMAYPNSSFKENESKKASFRNIGKNTKKDIESLAAELGTTTKSLGSLLNQPSYKKAFKATKGLARTANAILKLPNSALHSAFREMDKAGAFKKLQKGTLKVDAYLKKYPIVKKVAGPVVAGALVFQWLNMSFSGDFDEDFDIDSVTDALSGDFSIEQLLGTPEGIKAWTQLATGILTGGALSFPWHSSLTIGFATVYTAAKKAGNTKLAAKAQAKIKALMEAKAARKNKSSPKEGTLEV